MRPISVHALATSLRLPYETVRRRAVALAAEGRLVRDHQGLQVAAEWMARPAAADQSAVRHERLRRLHRDVLFNLGPDALGTPADRRQPVGSRARPLPLLTDHLANAYMLRVSEVLIAEFGDPFVGFVLLNIVRANIRHLPLEDYGFTSGGLAARRPARPSPLSKVLDVPPETLRRHIRKLERAGYLVRARGGMMLDDEAFRSRLAHALIEVAVANIRRMLGEMARAGLLRVSLAPRPYDGAPRVAEP
jgi:predicted ArsR family transcriptional regulator